jgi:hypothetical protein
MLGSGLVIPHRAHSANEAFVFSLGLAVAAVSQSNEVLAVPNDNVAPRVKTRRMVTLKHLIQLLFPGSEKRHAGACRDPFAPPNFTVKSRR